MRDQLDIFMVPLPLGGYNPTDDERSVIPNVAVDILNMDFDGNGLKTRDGYTSYTNSGLPAAAMEGMYVFKDSGANKYLIGYSDAALYVEGATGVFSSIKGSLTAGNPWNFATLADWAIGCNGVDEPVKYNGTTAYDLKVAVPATAPLSAENGAGVLDGTYQYKITYVSSSGAETNPSSSSTPLGPMTSKQVELTSIPTGTGDVASRKIYRTLEDGTVFYYLATIPDNVTTSYEDNLADGSLSTDLVPWTHTYPPSNGKFPMVYKEFLFMVDPDEPTRTYFSHQSYPEIFDTTEGTGYYLHVGLNDGEHIIGIKPLRGTLFFFKERSTWPVIGGSPDDFRVSTQPLTSSVGLYHKSMDYVDLGSGDNIIGLSENGLFLFDGYTYKNVGVQKDAGIDITDFIQGLDKNQLRYASGFNDKAKYRYRLGIRESGYGYNNKEIIWDYKRNRITITDITHNGMVEWNSVVLFCNSQSAGEIYQIGGINDDGAAISYHVEFPWWYVGDNFLVNFERINVDTVLNGDFSPTVTVKVDGYSVGIDLELGDGSDWTTSALVAEGGNYRAKVPLPIIGSDAVRLKGSAFKVRIEHDVLDETLNLNALALYYGKTQEYAGMSSV